MRLISQTNGTQTASVETWTWRSPWEAYEAARVHHASRRCSCDVAARRARAAARARAAHRRVLPATADDAEYQARVGAFLQALALSGWTIGRNVRIDTRWATSQRRRNPPTRSGISRARAGRVLAHGSGTVGALLQATRTVPIVFPIAGDPVGAGLVDSLARPGGNATGFLEFEYSVGGKWLELLKEIAPSVTRVAVLRDPAMGSGTGQFAAIQPRRRRSGWR